MTFLVYCKNNSYVSVSSCRPFLAGHQGMIRYTLETAFARSVCMKHF